MQNGSRETDRSRDSAWRQAGEYNKIYMETGWSAEMGESGRRTATNEKKRQSTSMQMGSGAHLNMDPATSRLPGFFVLFFLSYLFFQHDHSPGVMTFREYLSMRVQVHR